jgi:hypothetical protein
MVGRIGWISDQNHETCGSPKTQKKIKIGSVTGLAVTEMQKAECRKTEKAYTEGENLNFLNIFDD